MSFRFQMYSLQMGANWILINSDSCVSSKEIGTYIEYVYFDNIGLFIGLPFYFIALSLNSLLPNQDFNSQRWSRQPSWYNQDLINKQNFVSINATPQDSKTAY